MELTKSFVINCRKVGLLREFLCQAIDQIDEKDKKIAELKAMVTTDNSAVIARLEAENAKLKSCIKCLVMRDLIKDCPEKESVKDLAKEFV